ncbi:hypothetical protein S40288_04711 [Stachybotrys chartarum IBT 40288]|nr:hypothetical protein S40288_04711 [Stachybotrys chartarum IBT 40288]
METRSRLDRPWRRVALGFAVAALISFGVNFSFTVYMMAVRGSTVQNGIGVLAELSCGRSKTINLYLHIVINCMSATLLAGSNYCMQFVAAPTRSQIDAAHEKQKWLDIGVPSFRNLPSITWRNRILWIILSFSSLPLHLFFNSTVFASTSANHYYVIRIRASTFQRRDTDGFLEAGWTLDEVDQLYDAVGDACDKLNDQMTEDEYLESYSARFGGAVIRNTYMSSTPERCKLQFSLPFCWIVTGLNLLKSLVMLYVAYAKFEDPLLTVGDAVASFLESPDPYTESMCLATRKHFIKSRGLWETSPRALTTERKLLFSAASRGRWVFCLSLMVICISICGYFYDVGINEVADDNPWGWQLGTPDVDTMIELPMGSGASALLSSVLLANFPQVVLSVIYVIYNALFTCICTSTEWSSYADQRKGLRISSGPKGDQRETYFLQLPYKFSLPLISLSGVLHWLISQSIFIVALEGYSPVEGQLFEMESDGYLGFIRCGWSPLGAVLCIIVSLAMLCFPILLGFRRLRPNGMPLAGSCSAAIAAACHPGAKEPDAWKKPVKWGVVKYKEEDVCRCSFSSLEVQVPEKGQLYE